MQETDVDRRTAKIHARLRKRHGSHQCFLMWIVSAGPTLAKKGREMQSPTLPQALNPVNFDHVPNGNAEPPSQLDSLPQSPRTSEFSLRDRAVLASGLGLMRSARANLKNTDPSVSRLALGNLITAVFYIAGYLEGLGMKAEAKEAGFSSLVGALVQPDLSDSLDELERAIEDALLVSEQTRSPKSIAKTVISALGDVFIGIGAAELLASGVI